MNGFGTVLYDRNTGSRFYDLDAANAQVKSIPGNFPDAVYYYQKVSSFSDDLQLIATAQTKPEVP